MDASEGAVIWLWDFGDGSQGSMIPNPTHTFSKNGTYPVRLHVGNQAGGSDTITRDIIVSPYQEFTVDFTARPLVGTAPLSVSFTGQASDEVKSWRWNFGDGSFADSRNSEHLFRHEGSYTVSLTAWDMQGNSATKRKPGYIRVQNPSLSGAIPLSPGWNLISVPLPLSAGNDTAMIFRNIDSAGHSLFRYDTSAGGWTVLTPDAYITPFAAFWIFSGRNDTIPLSFAASSTPAPRKIPLGWSTIGIYGTESRIASSALESMKDQWVYCFGFDARLQQYQKAIIKGQNDQTPLVPYAGYWIYMSDPGTLST
jgi:PKD repeat protein